MFYNKEKFGHRDTHIEEGYLKTQGEDNFVPDIHTAK